MFAVKNKNDDEPSRTQSHLSDDRAMAPVMTIFGHHSNNT